jgi:uncharacterized protein (TIGR03067 family)
MKARILAVVMILLVAAGVRAADAKKELEKFQGSWLVVKLEIKGNVVPDEELKKFKLTFAAEKVTIKADEQSIEASFKIDPAQKPGHIEFTNLEGEDKGKTMLGIYEFDGEQLKICVNDNGKDRPKEFASPADSEITLLVIKKEK